MINTSYPIYWGKSRKIIEFNRLGKYCTIEKKYGILRDKICHGTEKCKEG